MGCRGCVCVGGEDPECGQRKLLSGAAAVAEKATVKIMGHQVSEEQRA